MKQGFQIVDQRKARRFRGRVGVMIPDESGLHFGVLTCLSRSGGYIEVQNPKSEGSIFSFILSNGRMRETIYGYVLRVTHEPDPGKVSGMGIKFSALNANAKRLRDDMMMYFMLEAHSPFVSAGNT